MIKIGDLLKINHYRPLHDRKSKLGNGIRDYNGKVVALGNNKLHGKYIILELPPGEGSKMFYLNRANFTKE